MKKLEDEKRLKLGNLNQISHFYSLLQKPEMGCCWYIELNFFPTSHILTPFPTQEVNVLRGQLGDRLSVELNTAPTTDLNRVLMRCVVSMKLCSPTTAETWKNGSLFRLALGAIKWQASRLLPNLHILIMPVFQTEELNQQQLSSAEQLQGCQTEILELKRTANALEIELKHSRAWYVRARPPWSLKNPCLRYLLSPIL